MPPAGLVRKYAPICNNMELTNCLWAFATLDMRNEEDTILRLIEINNIIKT